MTTRTVEDQLREAGDSLREALHSLADDVASRPVEYLTADETAAVLRVDVQTVRRMAKDGRLPVKRVGQKLLFPASAVRESAG